MCCEELRSLSPEAVAAVVVVAVVERPPLQPLHSWHWRMANSRRDWPCASTLYDGRGDGGLSGGEWDDEQQRPHPGASW